MFAISQDGTLYTHKGLDREVRDAYMLTIVAENTRGLRGGGLFQVRRKHFFIKYHKRLAKFDIKIQLLIEII